MLMYTFHFKYSTLNYILHDILIIVLLCICFILNVKLINFFKTIITYLREMCEFKI